LTPSLYSTAANVIILKSVGANIDNRTQIESYINSLRNEIGVYVDSFGIKHFNPPNETRQAISVLIELGAHPENIDTTVKYLLSLQYDDGTFLLNAEDGISQREDTTLDRVVYGTASVVNTLILLDLKEKIPNKTKAILMSEIDSRLGNSGPFPDLMEKDSWNIIIAIELLGEIEPKLVSERAMEFVNYALREITNMPPDSYVSTSRANNLLDIAHLLQLPAGGEKVTLDALRAFWKTQVLPEQNIFGGFGPSDTIDPLTTSENVKLASRLGVTYPHLDKLLAELDTHWVGNAWSAFLMPTLTTTSLEDTYFGIKVAEFSEFKYDKPKVEKFLESYLSEQGKVGNDQTETGSKGLRPQELYYLVHALKAVSGKLTEEDNRNAEKLCEEMTSTLPSFPSDNDTAWLYLIPISTEVGFKLSENVMTQIQQLTEQYWESVITKKMSIRPEQLLNVWLSIENKNLDVKKGEIIQSLRASYNEAVGAYTSLALATMPSELQPDPPYVLRPDIFQTYISLSLLSDIGESLPDENKTLTFVHDCKQTYGFRRSPDWPDIISLKNTFAALMILKQLPN
jgi:hypothetical protein